MRSDGKAAGRNQFLLVVGDKALEAKSPFLHEFFEEASGKDGVNNTAARQGMEIDHLCWEKVRLGSIHYVHRSLSSTDRLLPDKLPEKKHPPTTRRLIKSMAYPPQHWRNEPVRLTLALSESRVDNRGGYAIHQSMLRQATLTAALLTPAPATAALAVVARASRVQHCGARHEVI